MRIIILNAYAFFLLILFPGSSFSQVSNPDTESSRTGVIGDNTSLVLKCGPVVSSIPCGTIPDFGIPIVTNAGDPLVSITYADIIRPGIFPKEYSVTRIWTATDNNGNTDVCSRTIFVEDIVASVMTYPVVVYPVENGMSLAGLIDELDITDENRDYVRDDLGKHIIPVSPVNISYADGYVEVGYSHRLMCELRKIFK